MNLMKRRVYDMAGILKVKVYLNNRLVNIPHFKAYAKMHLDNTEEPMAEIRDRKGRWHILATRSDGEFSQVSFVNAISTSKGGTHVNYILDQIVSKILDSLSKKKIATQIRPFQVKAHLSLFINCSI